MARNRSVRAATYTVRLRPGVKETARISANACATRAGRDCGSPMRGIAGKPDTRTGREAANRGLSGSGLTINARQSTKIIEAQASQPTAKAKLPILRCCAMRPVAPSKACSRNDASHAAMTAPWMCNTQAIGKRPAAFSIYSGTKAIPTMAHAKIAIPAKNGRKGRFAPTADGVAENAEVVIAYSRGTIKTSASSRFQAYSGQSPSSRARSASRRRHCDCIWLPQSIRGNTPCQRSMERNVAYCRVLFNL